MSGEEDEESKSVGMSGIIDDSDRSKLGNQPAQISLKVRGQDGIEVCFRIKRTSQLQKLMTACCNRQSVDFNTVVFLYEGRRIRGQQTPAELDMEEGDEIDAMLHQTGGGS